MTLCSSAKSANSNSYNNFTLVAFERLIAIEDISFCYLQVYFYYFLIFQKTFVIFLALTQTSESMILRVVRL